jgi:hypothetical protein
VLGHTCDDDQDDVDVDVVLVVVDLELVEEAFALTLVATEEIPQLVIDKKLFDPLDITDDHFSYPFFFEKKNQIIYFNLNYHVTYI